MPNLSVPTSEAKARKERRDTLLGLLLVSPLILVLLALLALGMLKLWDWAA